MKNRISRKQLLTITLLILVVISVGFGLSSIRRGIGASSASAESPALPGPAVVATVEGKQIPASLYRMYLKNGIQAIGLSEKTLEGRRQIGLLKEGIIAELIDRSLIENEARRRNISISDKAFEEAYNKRIAEMGGRDLYLAYLSEHAIADEEFRQVVTQEIYAQAMQEELNREVAVSDSDVRAFYDKEKSNTTFASIFVEPETIRASHILIGARRSQIAAELSLRAKSGKAELDRLVSEEMTKRRARAVAVMNKLKAGADFASLARTYSDDPGTRAKGGELGVFGRDSHTAKFDDAAFALKPGRLSDIVETEYGYHIIRVSEHKPERTRSFDEAREAIQQRLLARKRAEHLASWLKDRRSQASIQVDPFYAVGKNE